MLNVIKSLLKNLGLVLIGRKSISWIVFVFVVAIYYAFVLNLPFLRHAYNIITALGDGNLCFELSVPVVVLAAAIIIFVVFLTRYTAKIILVPLTILSAVLFYASWHYGIIYDFDMVRNFALTNPAEAGSYVNAAAVTFVSVFGIIPAILSCLVKVRWPKSFFSSIFKRFGVLVACLAVVGGIFIAVGDAYISTGRNNRTLNREFIPFSFISAAKSYLKETYFQTKEPFKVIGSDAVTDNPGERPEVVVLVLGETARAQNYPENGYERNTTPYTSELKDFVTFKNVSSCGTATAQSVPCLFSNMLREDYKRSKAERVSNLLDVVMKAGYGVAWIENDGGCQGVCDRLPAENIINIVPANENPKYCTSDNCFDDVMIEKLPQVLASLKTRNKFVVLHIKGSHGPTYFMRTPQEYKKFTPSCERSDIQACTEEELTNVYDNTLVYTDHILKDVHDILVRQGENVGGGLFYISDHGESLGEYGLYLHGMPYAIAPETQKRVPLQMWFNNGFVADHKLDMTCLKKQGQKDGEFSHDNIFHSLLGLLDIETEVYDKELDLFAPCR